MGRMFSATFEEITVAAVQDFFNLLAPSDMSVLVHWLVLSQSSDAGDSESEQLSVLIHRGTTAGTGGTTPTPSPKNISDTSTVTVRANDVTTQSTEGAQLHAECFNVMAGLNIVWTPETAWAISPSTRFVVTLQTTPSDNLTMSGTIYFEEIGG